jgi:hypothetical protein
MSEELNESGGGGTPAANQAKTEATPVDEDQAAPPTGNLGSADPQAPTVLAQSAIDGGVPRSVTERRSAVPGRPGSPVPDETAGEPQVSADGGAPGAPAEGSSEATAS